MSAAAATAATSSPSKARNYSSQFQHQLPNNEKSRQFRHNHPSTPQVAAASRYASSRGTPVDEENNNSFGQREDEANSDAGTYTIEEDDEEESGKSHFVLQSTLH